MKTTHRLAAICGLALSAFLCAGGARAQSDQRQLNELIAHALPSVVSITTKTLADPSKAGVDLATAHAQESFGSGFVIDPAGYIATNRHVVDGAFDIIVTLADGTRLSGEVVGKGRKYDVAVIRVRPPKPLPTVTFADSDRLRLGDPLVVIGNPYGLGVSVSTGIVSALARNLGLTRFDRFIQTDAAINHGNSGGPIFDQDGKVMGMSTALYTGGVQKGGSIGIGFAIPSVILKQLLDVIRQYGYIRAGSFEIDARPVTPQIAAALGLEPKGVIIADVAPDGPANGLVQPGDVILALDGEPAVDPDWFYTRLSRALGHEFDVTLWRAGRTLVVKVKTVQWFDEKPLDAETPRPSGKGAMPVHFGIDLAPITPETRAQFNLPVYVEGTVVTAVQPDTPGAAAGFSVGDVIQRVQVGPFAQGVTAGKKMTADEIMNMMGRSAARMTELKKQGWTNIVILVRGSDGMRFITMPLDAWAQ